MFTIGNSKLIDDSGMTDLEKPALGDNYNVTGRELPFDE